MVEDLCGGPSARRREQLERVVEMVSDDLLGASESGQRRLPEDARTRGLLGAGNSMFGGLVTGGSGGGSSAASFGLSLGLRAFCPPPNRSKKFGS